MEIGCGVRESGNFDGRPVLLTSGNYERANGRSRGTRSTSVASTPKRPVPISCVGMAAYHRKVEQEFARKRARIEGLIAASHAST